MKPLQPTSTLEQHTVNTNVTRILSGNVSPGNGLTFDGSGQPLTFSTDNQSGKLFRIGPTGASGFEYNWPASNSNLTIQHNLNKVPYGTHVIAKNKSCDVFFGSVAPNAMEVTLQCTDATADTTVFVMV